MVHLPNYLLDLIDGEDDISIRAYGFESYFRTIWQEIENKNKTLKRLKITKRSFHQYMKGSRSFPISILYKICKEYSEQQKCEFEEIWNNIFERTTYFKSVCNHSRKIRLPKELCGDLAYLVGALRDGCLATYSKNINHFGVVYTQESHPEWLEVISQLFEKVFLIKPNLSKQLCIYNKPIFRFFERVFEHPPGNQGNWKTPNIITKAPTKIKNYYIQGFFDAEGVCSMSDFKLGFVQKNKESLEFIKSELEKQKISCGSILKDRNSHRFWICERKSVLRFIEKIGTRHPDKELKFKKITC